MTNPGRKPTPAHERVLARTSIDENGCWIYEGAVTLPSRYSIGGYGKVYRGGRTMSAHRVVYEALIGPIPDGLMLDHICRIKRCVRPDHLEPVTHIENMARTRKDVCSKGHDMSVHARPMGKTRQCWLCHLDYAKASRERAREKVA